MKITLTMDYPTFCALQRPLEEAHKRASASLQATRESIAAELGVPATGHMGLTPDAIKFDPRYRAAKADCDEAFARLREFNGRWTRRFKREIAADVHAARIARLATSRRR